MEQDPNPERSEVYERIPWEHLERRSTERQWLYVGVAGAIALGVLAYSFVDNQPIQPPPVPQSPSTSELAPSSPVTSGLFSPGSTVASPVVVTEADLFALDPELAAMTAMAHAEWFAVEYISFDDSVASLETLRDLLPLGLPLPEAPDGTQVFVDWASVVQVSTTGDYEYEVDVLVRSLLSTTDSGFVRQPVRLLRIPIVIEGEGQPRVVSAPTIMDLPDSSSASIDLIEVPEGLEDRVAADAEVIGGIPHPDGSWRVTVMSAGSDGVRRPHLLVFQVD